MKIDIHAHILPRQWPDLRQKYGYGGFIRLEHDGCGCAKMMRDGGLLPGGRAKPLGCLHPPWGV